LGVGAALVAGVMGPALGRRLRPVAREVVKQGIILGEGTRVRSAGLREDWDDLVAEARHDLHAQRQARRERPAPNGTSER
jgi:hypothetical protein